MLIPIGFLGAGLPPIGGPYFLGYAVGSTTGGTKLNYDIAVDKNGNFYVCGVTGISTAPNNYGMITKYDSSGTILWSKFYYFDTANTAVFYGITVDNADNVIVVGSGRVGTSRAIVLKLDSSGNLLWQRNMYGSSSTNDFNRVTVDSSNNIYITGTLQSGTPTYGIIVKYNSSGTLQWQRKLSHATASVSLTGISLDTSGNIYVTGKGAANANPLVAKYNSSGTLQWQKVIVGTTNSALAITIAKTGDIYLTSTAGSTTQVLFKLDSSGAMVWQYQTNTAVGSNKTQKLAVDSLGNIYWISTASGRGDDVGVIKVNSSGTIQWAREVSTPTYNNSDVGLSMTIDRSDNLYYAGGTGSVSGGGALFVKTLPNGSQTGTYTVNGASIEYLTWETTFSAIAYTVATTTNIEAAGDATEGAGVQILGTTTYNSYKTALV